MQNATHMIQTVRDINGGIQLIVNLPRHESSEMETLSFKQTQAIAADILGAFSKRIIASLERRQKACMEKLFSHIDTAFTLESGSQIFYRAKNNCLESFNLPTYEAMDDCIKALKHSCFREVLGNVMMLDQIVKALLNDPEQDHSDAGCFKYSQLVSLLMNRILFHE